MDAGAKKIDYFDAERTSCCPDLAYVFANYRPIPNQIAAWCEHGKHVKNLNISRYGHEFGVSSSDGSASRYPTWYRIDEPTRFRILQRDGFACVWCLEAIQWESIPQIPAVSGLTSRNIDSDTERYERMFFDHDADHLFTLDDWSFLDGQVRSDIKRKIGQGWIVAACERCNRGRREQQTPARWLLAIYARHLFERSGEPDFGELEDFMKTLRQLRIRRTKQSATGTAG